MTLRRLDLAHLGRREGEPCNTRLTWKLRLYGTSATLLATEVRALSSRRDSRRTGSTQSTGCTGGTGVSGGRRCKANLGMLWLAQFEELADEVSLLDQYVFLDRLQVADQVVVLDQSPLRPF